MDASGVDARDRSRLGLAIGASAIAALLWNVDLLAPALFPLRMVVTFAHEAGHGLTAIATGGDFIRFEIASNGSGLALTSGGWRWMVLPAGYLGAATSAAVVLVVAHRLREPRLGATLLAAAVGIIAILFGWTSLLALTAGLVTSLALFALARFASVTVTVLVMDVVAFLMGWSSVLDLLNILRQPSATNGAVTNDAAAFGAHVGLGGTRIWAALWLLAVVTVLLAAARFALGAPGADRPGEAGIA